jgi:uncharacterized hydrophobic protein (TIGR00271 family)
VVHLRIVAPAPLSERALELLRASESVSNVVFLKGAAHKPEGDAILADVAREDASVIIDDLRELRIPEHGAVAIEFVDTSISKAAEQAEKHAPGLASDAVIWEEVENRTSENTELSVSFVMFMALAMMIASIGILLDQPILIIGAMVVGPEFGPLAAVAVAIVELRGRLVRRSLMALAVGFPAGILAAYLLVELLRLTGLDPESFPIEDSQLGFISDPDALSVIVAYIAGTAGVLSLTSAKSGALIGVLISVTTIPAAANIGVAAAYSDWDEMGGAAAQLGLNLFAIVLAGVVTLYVQRRVYMSRRVAHLSDPVREAAGLPTGRSLSLKGKTRSQSSSEPGRSPRR